MDIQIVVKRRKRPRPEEIAKPCKNFVGNFHDETIGVKSIIIKK